MPRLPGSFAAAGRLKRGAPLILYAALALASTWPLARDLGTVIPAGRERAATVPLASAWALWWGSERVSAGFADYWDAPVMQPADDTFALSEPMPLLGAAAAPIRWLGGSLATAHGLVLLLCLWLNGLSIDRLARRLGAADAGAITAGAIGVLLPYVHAELGVLTLVPVFGLVWSLHAAIELAADPRWWRGLVLGAALAASYLVCAQHTLFLVMAAAPAGLWLVRRDRWRQLAVAAVPAIAVAGAAIGPIAYRQHVAVDEHDLRRGDETVRKGAASMYTWARAPFPALIPVPPVWSPPGRTSMFPGVWKLLAALAAMVLLVRRSRELRFLATAAAIGFAFSLLPRLSIGWFDPWGWLRYLVPGLDQIRSVHRFAVIVHIAIAVFAGLFVHHVCARWVDRGDRRRRLAAVAALAVMCVVELWPRGTWMAHPPSRAAYARVLGWIDHDTAPDDLLVHVPFAPGGSVEALEPEARAMYLATYHHRPIVNGYSSYWPARYRAIRRGFYQLTRGRESSAFGDAGIRYVLVHTEAMRARQLALPTDLGWTLVFRDPETAIDIYQLP